MRIVDRAELHFIGKEHEVDHAAHNVVWHGQVTHDEVVRLLPSMDLAVFPTNEDQLPQAAIEWATVGLSMIAIRMAAIPEICIDGVTGAIVPSGDDAHRHEQYGRAARALVEREFDTSKTFPSLIDRLVRLTNEPSVE